jgi:hypothetical protein
MVNQAGKAPAFGNGAFRRVVGIVNVEVRNSPDSDIRITVP